MVTMRSSILVNSFSPALKLPRQFGPVTARPVSLTACLQFDGEPLAFGILQFAEARGDDGGRARAGGGGVADHLHREPGRHQHQHVVGLVRQAGEILVAIHAPDRFAPGIDREKAAFVLVLDEVVPDALGIVAGLVGRADQHDVTRMQHRMDALDDVAGVWTKATIFRSGATRYLPELPWSSLTLLCPLAAIDRGRSPRAMIFFLFIET